MTARIFQSLLPPDVPWFDIETGRPTKPFFNYMRELDHVARSSILFKSLEFTFADAGLTLDIGNIPEGAIILKPISGIAVLEAFNSGTNKRADIGPSTNTDLWGTDLSLATIGFVPLDEAVSNEVGIGEGLVQLVVDLTGSAANAGIGVAIISYIIPGAA